MELKDKKGGKKDMESVFNFILFIMGLAYKQRIQLAKWLNYPYYAEEDRELALRRKIEDATKELADIEDRKRKEVAPKV